MQNWREIEDSGLLTAREKDILANSGFGQGRGCGVKPSLLVIDAQYKAAGSKDKDKYYPLAVDSEVGLRVVQNIKMLLEACRRVKMPIFYFKATIKPAENLFDSFAMKQNAEVREKRRARKDPMADKIVAEIMPLPDEVVVEKRYPSGFLGTPLLSFLNALHVDTLLVVGFTTSGCVRATVVDGFSYNYNVVVVEDCTGDRFEISHNVSLFDMDLKYADVVSLDDALSYVHLLKNPTE